MHHQYTFVAHAPTPGLEDQPPFYGPLGQRLAAFMGLARIEQAYELFDFAYLFDHWQSPSATTWADLRKAAAQLTDELGPHDKVVLVDNVVGPPYTPHIAPDPFTWGTSMFGYTAWIPQLGPWWDEIGNRARGSTWLRFLVTAVRAEQDHTVECTEALLEDGNAELVWDSHNRTLRRGVNGPPVRTAFEKRHGR